MSKTINIHPDLFKTEDGTRKKKEKPAGGLKLKFKSPNKHENKTTKRSILKFIRNHQDRNYRKMMDEPTLSDSISSGETPKETEFQNDFKESLNFLSNLVPVEPKKNQTLKHPPKFSMVPTLSPTNIYENVSLEFPTHSSPVGQSFTPSHQFIQKPTGVLQQPPPPLPPQFINRNNSIAPPKPLYGCLKNGNLPTYRQFHNKTMKHSHFPPSPPSHPIQSPLLHNGGGGNQNSIKIGQGVIGGDSSKETHKIPDSHKHHTFLKEFQEKLKQSQHKKLKYLKQKKTIRRTYKIGKSKTQPKVSVLLSNRTLRNTTSTRIQHLKQTPIDEIQRYLLKRGFIKVGSTAPNDVLRKMYESAILVCGEIYNHNPENLLYNFFHTNHDNE
jgi:hypothetical protein